MAAISVFWVFGCGQQDLTRPPDILYGRNVCAQCRMVIEEARFASAAVTAGGEVLKFDDLGCLASYEKKYGPFVRAWVQDAGGSGWVEREKAVFGHWPDLVTPMGYGFAAFSSASGAQEWGKDPAGRLLTWDELLTFTENQNQLKKEMLQ